MDGTAGGAWRRLADSLIAGIAHDLNGRLTALAGVAHLARSLPHTHADLADILDDQATRLAESIRMLRALPIGPHGEPELVRLSDVLAELAVLYRVRSGPEPPTLDLSGDDGVVVHAPPGALAETVLLLLAATEPRTATRAGQLIVRYTLEDGAACIAVQPGAPSGPSPEAPAASPSWLDPADAAAEARILAERLGGHVLRSATQSHTSDEGTATTARYELRLPAVIA